MLLQLHSESDLGASNDNHVANNAPFSDSHHFLNLSNTTYNQKPISRSCGGKQQPPPFKRTVSLFKYSNGYNTSTVDGWNMQMDTQLLLLLLLKANLLIDHNAVTPKPALVIAKQMSGMHLKWVGEGQLLAHDDFNECNVPPCSPCSALAVCLQKQTFKSCSFPTLGGR